VALAESLTMLPQAALRGDRLSMLEQWDLGRDAAIANEVAHGLRALSEGFEGAEKFAEGAGRHGAAARV
jgi:enoyl-CoA hydratase